MKSFSKKIFLELKNSNTCCVFDYIKCAPVSYADDLATCSLSKTKLDKAMQIVYNHGCRWRFDFNAKKSAVQVFGETKREAKIGAQYRIFKLGKSKEQEKE